MRARSESKQALRRVTAVAVLPSTEHCQALQRIFSRAQWTLFIAENLRRGIAILDSEPVAVAITGCSLPDGNWQDLLARLRAFRVPPPLIVVSHSADERLWAEVLDFGGYDVLAQPFDLNEVKRVVGLAWSSWKQECQSARRPRRQTGGVTGF